MVTWANGSNKAAGVLALKTIQSHSYRIESPRTSLDLMLLMLAVLGLVVVLLVIAIFEPKNVMNLLIIRLAATSADRISKSFMLPMFIF